MDSVTYTAQVIPTPSYSFKAASLTMATVWEGWEVCTFQGQERRGGASGCPGAACRAGGCHVLSITNPNSL